MEKQKSKVVYNIVAKTVDDAIDQKNKILINTTDKEDVEITIQIDAGFVF